MVEQKKQILEGKLSYIGAALILVGAFLSFILGKVDYTQLNLLIGAALSVAGIRRAVGRKP